LYHKFKASQLFTGTEMLDENFVLITKTDGSIETIVSTDEADEDVQELSGTLCPGFINAHCHLELSHMQGLIAEHTGLVDFVLQVVTQRHFPEDEILAAIEKAENEMLSAGIVAVGDICNNTLTVPQKKLHRLHYHNFIEVSGWNPLIADIRMERSLEHYHAFQQAFPEQCSLVPHAPYSVSNELWGLMQPYFTKQLLTIHNQETKAENELFQNGTGDFVRLYETMRINNPSFKAPGTNSLPAYFHQMQQAKQVILVHNSFTSQKDIDPVLQTNTPVSFCLCPNANLYIENSLPPIDLLLQNNLNICIGTDSLASNHQLSVLEEIKTLQLHFPHVSLATLLQAATLNGAKAFGMDDILGSFEKGKKPGVLLLENTAKITRLI
jgi:cytosine/adenosine deaminase-related metal-dependent hydrolase